MKFDLPEHVNIILNILKSNNHEAYVVGGCVRDMLLDKEPHDWDICTSAMPDIVIDVFREFEILPTGLKHGTVTLMMDNKPYEITTFRTDSDYSDHRRPDNVQFVSTLVEDLSRRDFTINAMAYSPCTGLVDAYGGHYDLQDRLIRCVGDPDQRFNEDGLRILRALRFASQLGFNIDEDTQKSIHQNKYKLQYVSNERKQSELSKILLADQCGYQVLRQYADVFCELIPEIGTMIGFPQNNIFHVYDIWEHTLHSLNGIDHHDDLITRLSVLLHDIGKPLCYTSDDLGNGHFYHHARESSQIAKRVLIDLRFSNEVIDCVTELIDLHDTIFTDKQMFVRRMLNRIGEQQFRRLIRLKECDIIGQHPSYRDDRMAMMLRVKTILNHTIMQNACFSLKNLAVNGNDLMSIGVPEGRQIGAILHHLLDMVINEEIENTHSDLMQYAKRLKEVLK